MSAEHERLWHTAEQVVAGARKRNLAAMQVSAALETIRTGLNHPTGNWSDSERAALSRLRQQLEAALEALELLQP